MRNARRGFRAEGFGHDSLRSSEGSVCLKIVVQVLVVSRTRKNRNLQ